MRLNLHETLMDNSSKAFLTEHGEGRLRYSVNAAYIYMLAGILLLAIMYMLYRVGVLTDT